MSKTKEKLIIIDGNALIHRSFHALPPTMTTKSGEIINAVYGFTSVLIKAIKELKPDYVVLTLDKKGPTFRHLEYKEYKATRVKAPDELYAQIGRVKEVAKAFSIPIFEQAGLEADDLIGTIVRKIDQQIEKIILTGDMDTLQLVNEHTKVYGLGRGINEAIIYDEQGVRNRYGLEPDQIVDFKALRGDPSDNIPGVRGIGEKTAVELLQNFETLENLYKHLDSDKIKDRIKGLLETYKNEAFMSKSLATIKLDAEIDFDLAAARFGGYDQAKLVKLFSDLEFKSLLVRAQEIGKQVAAGQLQPGQLAGFENKFERNQKLFKYVLVDDEKKFKLFFNKLKSATSFVFDTETTGIDPITAELLGVSFCWQEGEAYFLELSRQDSVVSAAGLNLFNYSQASAGASLMNPWLAKLKPIFENQQIKKFAHNIKFDLEVLESQGIFVKGAAFDTMIASYVLNPGTRQHNLDAVTFTELGFEKISKEELLGKGKDKLSFGQVPIEKLSLYSCEDADFTWRLRKKLNKQLKAQGLEKLFAEIEMPLAPVLARMEMNGIKVDRAHLARLSKKLHAKIKQLEKTIYDHAGKVFNINSPRQLQEILFEELEISTMGINKTKTGLSTSADELEKLKEQHEIIQSIQEYRELTKLLSTYIDSLPKLINQQTGRVHTSYNQTVAATGRLSSSDPNLQNIPAHGEWGKSVRQSFVAETGYKFISLDYSQIELRLVAHMSTDKKMIAAFKQGLDIHLATAAAINEIEPEKVTKEMRSEAKAVNFGVLYGQGPHGLSQTAEIPYMRAKEFIDNYFEVYGGVKQFIEQTIEEVKLKGFSQTLFGRKRYLPEINSSVMQLRKAAERMAINTPLQGTAADMIKVAMIEAERLIEKKYSNKDVRMLLQVHDELLLEVKTELVETVANEIKQIMEQVIKLKVPVIAEVKVGDNWEDLG